MRLAKHILAVLTVVLLFTSCGGKNDKVIPRGKLAEIYAEMLILDQWISTRQGARRTADTTLVYEPILEKYGYTSADYRRSVDEYMNDPERYSRILRTTVGIMDDKLAELAERKAEIEHLAALQKLREALKIEVNIDLDVLNPYLFEEPYVHYYDSLSVEPDSMKIYRFRNIDRGDTIYRDLRMIILDTLAAKDSLSVKDTLAVKDTIK